MGIIKELEREIAQLENISLDCSGELSSELNRVREIIQETLLILKSDDETVTTYEYEIKLKIQQIEKELKNLRENLLNKIKPSYLQGNKFSKYLDNNFTLNLSVIPPIENNNSPFNSNDTTNNLLNQIVIQHLIRNGKFELAEKFSDESLTPYPEDFKAQFEDMYQILEAMKERQLEPALEWCLAHLGDATVEEGESLVFKIHRLQYCYYLSQGKRLEALAYAKKRLAGFTGKYLQEIQKLLCSSLYQSNPQIDSNSLNTSPYSDLYKESDWEDIQYYFVRYFCKVMGRSHEPPLYVTVTAGTTTLPKVVKAMNIMNMQNVTFDEKVELPIDLQLTDDMKYHSIFLCPINKEWATEENPPMLLPCGHAICKDSLNMLSKGGTRFKCTYCPNESLPSQAQILYF